MNAVHWHVLGAGAMGCLFASQLAAGGCPVTLLLRSERAPASVRIQLERDGTSRCFDVPASHAAAPGAIDYLLVTTKAQDVCASVLSVAARLHASSQVLVLANGLGHAEELRTRLPVPEYFHGTTTAGAYRQPTQPDRRHVHHAGSGLTRIGRHGCDAAPDWFSQWSDAVRPSAWDPDIEQALWLKLAINCAINPLTAVHRCRNGGLASAELAPRVQALCEEIMSVSAAAGFAAATADLPEKVSQVIRATAENRSSMLQDVLAGRVTEIDYITGYLVRVAHGHGLAVPHNEAIYRSIIDHVA